MKKLNYNNLVNSILDYCNIDNNFDIFYQNEKIGYFELNEYIDKIELIVTNKYFYKFICSKFIWTDKYLIWDWSDDTDKQNISNNINKVVCLN